MTLKTLQNLDKELNYLLKEGDLEDVLAFLGIRYYESNFKRGSKLRYTYEFEDTGLLAIEVSFTNKEIRFWGMLQDSIQSLISKSFWVWFVVSSLNLFVK